MNTIISKGTQEYRMSVIYDKTTRTYILIFSSTKDNHGQQFTCSSYRNAVERFEQNCRFYGVPTPRVPLTEEEFLGIDPAVIYPHKGGKKCRA